MLPIASDFRSLWKHVYGNAPCSSQVLKVSIAFASAALASAMPAANLLDCQLELNMPSYRAWTPKSRKSTPPMICTVSRRPSSKPSSRQRKVAGGSINTVEEQWSIPGFHFKGSTQVCWDQKTCIYTTDIYVYCHAHAHISQSKYTGILGFPLSFLYQAIDLASQTRSRSYSYSRIWHALLLYTLQAVSLRVC